MRGFRQLLLAVTATACTASPATTLDPTWYEMYPAAPDYGGPTVFVGEVVYAVPAQCGCERDFASAGEGRQASGSGEQRDYAGAGEDRKFAGAGEDRKFAGAGEDREVAGSTEQRSYAGAAEDRGYAGAGEARTHAGAGEDRSFAGANSVLRCRPSGSCDAVELDTGVFTTIDRRNP